MLILGRGDVEAVLHGREREIIDLVAAAYRSHDEGRTAVPHSVFLRFPGDDRNRIIGLPAFVGGGTPAAGMKWIASFPDNVRDGRPRASATIVLNSLDNGYPEAVLEGSVISARRTAASAAVAARRLFDGGAATGVSLIGCGVINTEVLRFLPVAMPGLREATVFDLDRQRAHGFAADGAGDGRAGLSITVAPDIGTALGAHRLVSFATTAGRPHTDLRAARPGAVVLHLSLRDLTPEAILAAHNIVDDADHVCREQTSAHLTEQRSGGRAFVDASIGALLRGGTFARDPGRPIVFSPFGLGALDIALAGFVHTTAVQLGLGHRIDDFHPATAPAGALG